MWLCFLTILLEVVKASHSKQNRLRTKLRSVSKSSGSTYRWWVPWMILVALILIFARWGIVFIIWGFLGGCLVTPYNWEAMRLRLCAYLPTGIGDFTCRFECVTIKPKRLVGRLKTAACANGLRIRNPMRGCMWQDSLTTSKFWILSEWWLCFRLECILTCKWQTKETIFQFQCRKKTCKWRMHSWRWRHMTKVQK